MISSCLPTASVAFAEDVLDSPVASFNCESMSAVVCARSSSNSNERIL